MRVMFEVRLPRAVSERVTEAEVKEDTWSGVREEEG